MKKGEEDGAGHEITHRTLAEQRESQIGQVNESSH